MAKINDIRLKAKRYKAKPVCVTLHNGETYIGYIAEVNNGGVVLTGGGTALSTPTSGDSSHRSNRNRKAVSGSKVVSSHKRNRAKAHVSRLRSRQMSQAQVSSFLPMMGSLFGGLGGGAAAGGVGGLLGGGMRLFGMIQQFVPVVKWATV